MWKSRVVSVVLALGWALLASSPVVAESCPDGATDAVRVSVSLDYTDNTISVSPNPVTIYKTPGEGQPGVVCWVVDKLKKNRTLHIEAKAGQSNLLSSRQVGYPNNFANSGRPTGTGEWKYLLRVTKGASQTMSLDPVVIIKKGSGGK